MFHCYGSLSECKRNKNSEQIFSQQKKNAEQKNIRLQKTLAEPRKTGEFSTFFEQILPIKESSPRSSG